MNIWDFKDKHKGAEAIAMATGTSLVKSGILNEITPEIITIGVNDIGRIYDPMYLMSFDSLDPKDKIYECWKKSNAVKFLSQSRSDFGTGAIPITVNKNTGLKDWFTAPEKTWFLASATSSLLPIQLAIFMGCKKITLIGADFCTVNGMNHAWDVETNTKGKEPVTKFYNSKDYILTLMAPIKEKVKEWGIEVIDRSYGFLWK
jgi:hypothetical protein